MTDVIFIQAGTEGFTLYFKGLMYSKIHLTDGVVPTSALPLIGIGIKNPKRTAQLLVDLHLWAECEGGYTVGFEKWSKHQTTKEEVDASREDARLRKQTQRDRDRQKREEERARQANGSQRDKRDSHAVTGRGSHMGVTGTTETETETENKPPKPPTLADVIMAGADTGIPEAACRQFFDEFSSQGWKLASGEPIRTWRLLLRKWTPPKAPEPPNGSTPEIDLAAIRMAVHGR